MLIQFSKVCEYKHSLFQKGKRELLERISRQPSISSSLKKEKESSNSYSNNNKQSSVEDIQEISSVFFPITSASNGNQLYSLEQGQRRSFYQIKDLERRIDFVEKELGSCRYILDSQSRLIKKLLLLANFPTESNKNSADLLNQNWHEPSFDPYPYHPANYGRSYQNGTQSSTSSANSNGSNSNLNNNINGAIHQSSNISNRTRSDSISNCADIKTLSNPSYGSKSNSIASGNTAHCTLTNAGPDPKKINYHPFNNQAYYTRPRSLLPDRYYYYQTNFSFAKLNVLILVSQQIEKRLLSDLLIEIQCLSHKFAFDISHVLHCLEDKIEFHILFLDRVYESESLLSRLRQLCPEIMIIFITDSPLSLSKTSNLDRFILRPPTLESIQVCFQDFINPSYTLK